MKNNQSTHELPKSEFSSPKTNRSIPQICKLPKPKSSDKSWLTIHNQFTTYGRNAKEWMRKCALLLPQIEKQQIWRKKGFRDIYDYAAKLAGMNHDQVNEALRVLHKAEIFPSLMKVIETKGLNAVKPVLGIITKETENLFAEKAMTMNKNTLEIFVRHVRENNFQITGLPRKEEQSVNLQNTQSRLALVGTAEIQADTEKNQQLALEIQPSESSKVTLVLQLDPQLADHLQKVKGQSDWNETIRKLLKLRQEKLEEKKPATVENATRHIPAKIEKYAIAKTNSTCAFPGCTKSYEILHHTNRFAQYHSHDPDHIIPLCEAHERLAHLGLIENENQSPENWKLRARPDYDDPKYEVDRMVEKFRRQT